MTHAKYLYLADSIERRISRHLEEEFYTDVGRCDSRTGMRDFSRSSARQKTWKCIGKEPR